MKKNIATLVILLTGGFLAADSWADPPKPPNNLLPVPANITWKEGALPLDSQFHVQVKSAEESRVQGGIQRFVERLQKRTGLTFQSGDGKSDHATLVIEVKNK